MNDGNNVKSRFFLKLHHIRNLYKKCIIIEKNKKRIVHFEGNYTKREKVLTSAKSIRASKEEKKKTCAKSICLCK